MRTTARKYLHGTVSGFESSASVSDVRAVWVLAETEAIDVVWQLRSRDRGLLVCEMRPSAQGPEIRLIHNGELLECVVAGSRGQSEEYRVGLGQMLVAKGRVASLGF